MGGLFSSPKPPAPTPPVRMPSPDDQASLEAKRNAQNTLLGMRGRESTDLSNDGGNNYINDVLGK